MKRRPSAAAPGRSAKRKPAAAARPAGHCRTLDFGSPPPVTPDGAELRGFELIGDGLRVEIINWGAYVTKVLAPDVDGAWDDVVLGFDTPHDASGYYKPCLYGGRTHWFGSVIGRYAGRIASGRFELNGQSYQLDKNLNEQHHLHGGKGGWDTHTWQPQGHGVDATTGDPYVSLSRVSPDGEEGYPAELGLTVRYSIAGGNSLKIEYTVQNKDEHRATVVNVTNHSYFNLSGKFDCSIYDHALLLNSDTFLAVDATGIPVSLNAVHGTPFDFTHPRRIGDHVDDTAHDQIERGSGYDHTYVVNKSRKGPRMGVAGLTFAASVTEPSSRRKLEVFTTEPGVHLYSGNHVPFTRGALGKRLTRFGYRSGFCLETQHFPDSPNHPEYPSTALGPGKCYRSCTVYRLGIASADECLPPRHAAHRLSRFT